MGGSQGESSGDSRGSSLTNGDLSEEQIPGPVARRQSSKSHGSPGNSAGRKVCSPRHGVMHSLRTQAFYIYVVTLLRKLLKGSIQENNHVTPRYSEW